MFQKWDKAMRRTRLAAIALFLFASATQASKPLHLDSADLPVWAEAVAKTGKPVAYRGEDRPADLFVYHTPLYLYLLGGWFNLFGYGPTQVRLFGALCALVFGAVIVRIFGLLLPVVDFQRFSTIFWPLFLISPYTVQAAAIADIDTSIYGPLLCGFLLCLVRMCFEEGGSIRKTEPTVAEVLLCSSLLGLCFWAKLTTVLLFLLFPFLLFIPKFGLRRSVRLAAATVGAGISLFLVTFLAWSRLVGANPLQYWLWLQSYVVTRGSRGNTGIIYRLQDFISNFLMMGPFTFRWMGLLPWACAIAALGFCMNRALRRPKDSAYAAAIIFGIAVFGALYYAGQTLSFGASPFKYHFVFWGMIAGAAAYLYVCCLAWEPGAAPVISRAGWIALASLFLVSIALSEYWLRDRVLWPGPNRLLHYWPFWVMLTGVCVAILCGALRRKHLMTIVALGLLAFHIGIRLGIVLYQIRQTYSTTYNYGQVGLEDTACYIKSISNPSDTIGAMKDLGPLTERRFYENYPYLYGGSEGANRFINLLAHGKIRYAIFTQGIGEDQLVMNPRLRKWVLSHCHLLKSIGNYRVYEVASNPMDRE